MKRATYQRLLLIAKIFMAFGLAIAILWNVAVLRSGLDAWWLAILLPLPGLFGWLGLVGFSTLSTKAVAGHPHTYRLLYSAPEGWTDYRVRQAFLTLLQSGTSLDIIWAKDGDDIACWMAVSGFGGVLVRLVQDVFPNGSAELSELPEIGQGVTVLHWQQPPPAPVELCRKAGIDGVYFRWHSEQTATVAIWGPAAATVVKQLARSADLLPGQGQSLLASSFAGDNPWPELPPFPPPAAYPGLSAVSQLEKLAPPLRVKPGVRALSLGQDAEMQPVGFTWPELDGMNHLQIMGQASEAVVISLVQQAVQRDQPVLLLDGQGVVTTRLARRLLREVATERVLMCDVERPGQSRFHLNPLWLPGEAPVRLKALSNGWPAWLREQGVTAAGLGLASYHYTQVAVLLTALVSVERDIAVDIVGLQQALQAPDFLKLVGEETWSGCGLLDDDIWRWWREDGRATSSFDMHLRLAHLRDRLGVLLDLPEYSVLWRGPYLDPLSAVNGGQSLFWRLPDPRRRLPAYISSQLLVLNSLLTASPGDQPLLIVLHELPAGTWIERLTSFPNTRLISATTHPNGSPAGSPTSLLLSRLDDVPPWIRSNLPDIRPTDLQRLPVNRLVLTRGDAICTVDMVAE